ncbi:competence protein ComK [Gracilibacillus alcaliphilus]|uniref:competence protein ComK n=1 Tax=Gracilibacillus alcaliphilus TaxID=1401441 RepID=UPI001EF954A6|nr:competence protein ComK [Gracilibacillus alcaliphilus]MBM7675422.1 competence protein ComK [Gracilibacillus alcaliphilus]
MKMTTSLNKVMPEVSPSTLAVIGFHEGKSYWTKVMEMEEADDFETDWNAQQVMDHTCKGFGISLKGLLEGTRMLSGISYKPPIAIDRFSGMYFFPLESPSKKSCSWIAHSHVLEIDKADTYYTRIVFKNGRELLLNVSYASLLNQLYRTAQYRYLLSNKIESLLEHSQFVSETPWQRKK